MPTFDISSEVNLQELDNAINQTTREISTRYDFRGTKGSLTFDKTKNIIHILADDDYKMTATIEILMGKAAKRLSLKSLKTGTVQDGPAGLKKCEVTLVMGIETDKAREIVKYVKESKLKVQAQIQDEKVRISGKKRDDLQEAIALLKAHDFDIPLEFGNFRD